MARFQIPAVLVKLVLDWGVVNLSNFYIVLFIVYILLCVTVFEQGYGFIQFYGYGFGSHGFRGCFRGCSQKNACGTVPKP